jgi:hypothetical protein
VPIGNKLHKRQTAAPPLQRSTVPAAGHARVASHRGGRWRCGEASSAPLEKPGWLCAPMGRARDLDIHSRGLGGTGFYGSDDGDLLSWAILCTCICRLEARSMGKRESGGGFDDVVMLDWTRGGVVDCTKGL